VSDPIVDEVRRHRMEHTREFGFDLEAICNDLRRKQALSNREIVRLPPKRLQPATVSDTTP